MKSYAFLIFGILVILTSCSPKIATHVMKTRPPVGPDTEIMVFDTPAQLSDKTELLGTVTVDDAGAAVNCSYDVMLGLLKEEARKLGGNAVRILVYRPPDILSSCHRFEAEVLFVPAGEKYSAGESVSTGSEIEEIEWDQLDPDLIVFTNGDSIYCTILRVKSTGITYSFTSDHGQINSTVPMLQVLTYSKNYNRPALVRTKAENINFSQVRLNIYGAYSYMTGEIDEDFSDFYQDYLKELKNGWSVGGDICFFIDHDWGLGIKLNRFFSSNFYGNVYMLNGTTSVAGDLSNKIRSTFIGPIFTGRYILRNSGHAFYYSLGMGYLGYSNDGEIINQAFYQTGNTLGSSLDIGFDFAVREHVSLGIQLSAIGGKLSQVQEEVGGRTTTYSLNKEEFIGVGTYDVAASLKYNF